MHAHTCAHPQLDYLFLNHKELMYASCKKPDKTEGHYAIIWTQKDCIFPLISQIKKRKTRVKGLLGNRQGVWASKGNR